MALTITSTDGEVPKPVNVMMAQSFLRRASQKLPYFMGVQPGTLMKNGGSATLKWRRVEQLAPTTTPLGELTGVASYMQGRDASTPSITDVLATVAKFGQFYVVNEEVDIFNPNGTLDELTDSLGEAAGRSLNQLQRDVAEDDLTQRFAGNVASDGAVTAKVAAGDLKRVVQELWTNSARTFTPIAFGSQNVGTSPLLPSFWGICHPHVANDLADLTGWKSVETYAVHTRTVPGEFGYFAGAGMGIRFVGCEDASIDLGAGATVSSLDLNATSGNVDLYTISIYGRDAMGSVGLGQQMTDGAFEAGDDTGDWELIIHQRGSGGTSDPYNEIATYAWKAWHAGAVLNTAWGRALRVGATNFAN